MDWEVNLSLENSQFCGDKVTPIFRKIITQKWFTTKSIKIEILESDQRYFATVCLIKNLLVLKSS